MAHSHTLTPLAALEGHDGRAWGVAWSPDGERENEVERAANCACVPTRSPRSSLIHISHSQGATLASCGADRTIRLWTRSPDTCSTGGEAGTEPHLFTCTAILEESATRTIRTLAWSPCGARLAAACFDATTAVWEKEGSGASATWRQAAVLQGHESEVKGVAWSPGGTHLASCSRDKSVWVWEVVGDAAGSSSAVEYECADVKQGHSGDVKAVAWHPAPEGVAGCSNPGGGFLVSAAYDETLRVWADAGDEWVCAQVLGVGDAGHAGTVWCLDFEKPGGSGGPHHHQPPRLVSGGGDSTLRVWTCTPRPPGSAPDDDTSWKVETSLNNVHGGRPVYGVAWAPPLGGSVPAAPSTTPALPARLASGGGDDAVRVWEEASPSAFVEVAVAKADPPSEVNAVAWCPADRDVLAAAGDDGVVRVWRVVGQGKKM